MPSIIKHKVGAVISLPIDRVVEIRGNKYYVVRYENTITRVQLYDWQLNEDVPKSLQCRLTSINDFGFPVFEQVAATKEVKLIDPIAPENDAESDKVEESTIKNNKKKNEIKITINANTKDDKLKEQESLNEENNIENNKLPEGSDITHYFWREQSESFEEWFITTGGIKRRLEILISLAEIIAKYHRQNKVYKELVPEYIRVVVDKNHTIKVSVPETNYLTSGLANVFIYASISAPEVVNRWMPNTPMSDCYTFAIIVHELLSFCHPFIGDKVLSGDITYDEAFRGRLSWIDKKDDSTNRLTRRMYDCFFTTPQIRELYYETFDKGKTSPLERPTIYKWIDVLKEAQEHLLYCQNCETEYLYFEDGCCAFCDEEPTFELAVDIIRVDKKFDLETYQFKDEMDLYLDPIGTFLLNRNNPVYINSRHLITKSKEDKEILKIVIYKMDDYGNLSVKFCPLNNYIFNAYTINKEKLSQLIDKETNAVFPKKFPRKLILSIDEINHPQRLLIIRPI